MTIINVIQIGQTSQSLNQGVIDIKSFVVKDEQLYSKVEEEAENYFKELLKQQGITNEDVVEEALIDRFYENLYCSISIIFTQPENLQ